MKYAPGNNINKLIGEIKNFIDIQFLPFNQFGDLSPS